jgi:hypothetical protein
MNNTMHDDPALGSRPYLGPVDPFDPYNGQQLTITGLNNGFISSSVLGPEEFIKGQMVNAQVVVKDFEITQMNLDPDQFKQTMKKRLVEMIAEKLLNEKLVEFTKQEDLHTNETTFRARAYLVQDDKVRILRKELK